MTADDLARLVAESDDDYAALLGRRLLNPSAPDAFGVAQSIFHRTTGGMTRDQFRAWLAERDEARALHPPPGAVTPFHGRIEVRSKSFFVNGQRTRIQGVSLFHLLRDYLRGVDLTPSFEWARKLDANYLRVFTRLAWSPLRESDYGDDQLLAFVRHCASQGLASRPSSPSPTVVTTPATSWAKARRSDTWTGWERWSGQSRMSCWRPRTNPSSTPRTSTWAPSGGPRDSGRAGVGTIAFCAIRSSPGTTRRRTRPGSKSVRHGPPGKGDRGPVGRALPVSSTNPS